MTAETIYALSSGAPPAAIAVVRISGAGAEAALEALTGKRPEPRVATLVTLRDAAGERLDTALALRFPGPASATGEDLAELHLHGGRAVVAAVLRALGAMSGLREAEAGEFTRRAFENGRVDLDAAEGLADLLEAETESQRRAALAMAGGAVGRLVSSWRERLIDLAAALEAVIDFSDEGEVGEGVPSGWFDDVARLRRDMDAALAQPVSERLREGIRVVIAGPPNAGKSSLLNYLAGRRAAITSAVAGTTRDLIEAPTAIGGTPFVLVDTAGLRESADEVEAAGVGLARASLENADLVLWLGAPHDCPVEDQALIVQSKVDLYPRDPRADLHVSAETGEGMEQLIAAVIARGRSLLPREGEVVLNRRQRDAAAASAGLLIEAETCRDLVLTAEALRHARSALDRIAGRGAVEDVLDAVFSRFCIGK